MTAVGPVSHVTCDLAIQRRTQDACRDAALRAALGRSSRTIVERLLGRPADRSGFDPAALRPSGEDLLRALRY